MRRMMMLLVLFLPLLAQCNVLPAASERRPDDVDEVQELVRHAVLVKVVVTVDVTSLMGPDSPTATMGWWGSGAIVARDAHLDETLVLTAKHVCQVPAAIDTPIGSFPVVRSLMSVRTHTGRWFYAETFHESPYSDSCVMRAFGSDDATSAVEVADELPPIGAVVHVVGAPMAIFDAGMVPIVDGRFSGVMNLISGLGDWRVEVVTVPVAPGQSGSGVYYRGRLFGVVSMRHPAYEHLCFCVHLSPTRSTVEHAVSAWKSLAR